MERRRLKRREAAVELLRKEYQHEAEECFSWDCFDDYLI